MTLLLLLLLLLTTDERGRGLGIRGHHSGKGLSLCHFLCLCRYIHLHVIIVKSPTTPAYIYQLPLIRVRSVWLIRRESRQCVDSPTGPLYLCTGTVRV